MSPCLRLSKHCDPFQPMNGTTKLPRRSSCVKTVSNLKKVAFDNSFATLLFNKNAKVSIPGAAELVDDLIQELADQQAKVIIPTPVLSEILIKAGKSGPTYIEVLKP